MTDRSTVWQKTAKPLAAITLCCAALVSLQGCVGTVETYLQVVLNSFNRKVLLTGEVADGQAKATADREMRGIEGVASVANELQVAGVSNYTSRSNDALITGKVKASFVDTKDLYASAFKVVTESNVVYLMGRVTQREGNLAGEVARGVSGVRKVVKVFDYISEGELKEMMATPDTSSKDKDSSKDK